jgi:hypothetical protein
MDDEENVQRTPGTKGIKKENGRRGSKKTHEH